MYLLGRTILARIVPKVSAVPYREKEFNQGNTLGNEVNDPLGTTKSLLSESQSILAFFDSIERLSLFSYIFSSATINSCLIVSPSSG